MAKKNEDVCACNAENGKCSCKDGGCNCGCSGKSKLLVKSAVMVACSILISGAILTAGYDGRCPLGKMGPAGGMPSEKAMADFIMKNPKLIIDSVDQFYKGQDQGAKAAQPAKPAQPAEAPKDLVAKILADKTNHVLGNPNGSFVIIEFFDYQCGWCKKTNVEIGEAIKTAKNIRWVLIDTPIFGEASETIARYGMAAAKQGKYKEMHEAIVSSQDRLDEAALIKIGEGLKLDTAKLKADANSKEAHDKIAANQAIARTLNINGVPMLIVDGKINPGALIGDRLKAAVEASNKK